MQQENARRDFLLNISTNALLETDLTGRILYLNAAAGYLLAPNTSDSNIAFVFEDEAPDILSKIEKAIHSQKPQILQIFHNERYNNLYFYGHKHNCYICIEDITERRQLAFALERTTLRLEFAEKTAHIGYWELDFKDKKIYWSGEMFRIFGTSAASASPKRNLIRERMLKEDLPIYKE